MRLNESSNNLSTSGYPNLRACGNYRGGRSRIPLLGRRVDALGQAAGLAPPSTFRCTDGHRPAGQGAGYDHTGGRSTSGRTGSRHCNGTASGDDAHGAGDRHAGVIPGIQSPNVVRSAT